MLGTLDETQIDEVLRSEVIGRLGCHAEGRTYIVPITYAYDGQYIYCHSLDGLKLRLMRANPRVCFEVEHIDNMANWQTVIAWGTFEPLEGVAAEEAMRRLVSRLLSLSLSETIEPLREAVSRTYAVKAGDGYTATAYRIRLEERTGRFEREHGIELFSADEQERE